MKELEHIIDKDKIIYGALLKNYTSFKVGGPCKAMVFPESPEEISSIISFCKDRGLKYYLLGNGTNVIALDEGYNGVVIRIGDSFSKITCEGNIIKAQAGALMSSLANAACEAGLSGLEFAGGIPGSVGGGIVMNAGAYDGELKDVVHSVTALKDGKIVNIDVDDCDFGYRTSIFQKEEVVVLEAEFRLDKGMKAEIRKKIDDFNKRRREKQPLSYPSAGSTFRRPEGYFAGKLIQDSGLKGVTIGGAAVSDLHAGFVINKGGATAKDILDLIELIKNTVYDKYKVDLRPEVRVMK